jgi:antitoxin VapB
MPDPITPRTLSTEYEFQNELQIKRSRIQALLAERNADAILIARHENIAWFTAGQAEIRIGILRETGPATLLVTKDDRVFYLTTNHEAPRLAEEEFFGLAYTPIVQPWYAADQAAAIRSAIGEGTVLSDAPNGTLPVVPFYPLRAELTDGEITRYRWLGRAVADTTSDLLKTLAPGMPERVIQAQLMERLVAQGILPSVLLDAVDDRIRKFRHAVPRDGVLERFGMLNFCARRWGLTISITRYIHFGPMSSELEDKFAVVAQVSARLLAATRAGATADELFHVAQAAYTTLGHPGEETMHHQGGATGYMEREWVARPGGTEQVATPQAFAWNPSLQGAKVEDTVLLRDSAIEVLTETPALPVMVTSFDGLEYRSAGVLRG